MSTPNFTDGPGRSFGGTCGCTPCFCGAQAFFWVGAYIIMNRVFLLVCSLGVSNATRRGVGRGHWPAWRCFSVATRGDTGRRALSDVLRDQFFIKRKLCAFARQLGRPCALQRGQGGYKALCSGARRGCSPSGTGGERRRQGPMERCVVEKSNLLYRVRVKPRRKMLAGGLRPLLNNIASVIRFGGVAGAPNARRPLAAKLCATRQAGKGEVGALNFQGDEKRG